jgi:MFS family permease
MTIAIADIGALCCSLSIGVIARMHPDGVQVRHILAVNTVNGICSAFQGPASMASLPLLVPLRHRERAIIVKDALKGIINISTGFFGGMVAGLGVALADLLWIDLCGYLLGASALILVPFPKAKPDTKKPCAQSGSESIMAKLSFGARYIWKDGGIFKLAVLTAITRFCFHLVA